MFPVFPNPTPAPVAVAPAAPSLLPDLLFDYAGPDFVLQGGDIAIADGYRAWVQAWSDMIMVQQAAHPIYPRSYGIDHDAYMQGTRQEVEARYTARLVRLAQQERATRQVRNIVYTWQSDGTCTVEMEIVAVTGDTVKMGVSLSD